MLADKIQLGSDENVLIQVRKHWFVLVAKLFGLVVTALAPFVLGYTAIALLNSQEIAATVSLYANLLTFVYVAWLVIVWMMIYNTWTDYYLDVWTVTNRRIIAVDQRGLFSRNIGSFRLERLQDVNVEIRGIIATFLDFGTIEAQTAAGSEEEFRMHGLPKPRELKALILKTADNLIDEYRNRPRLSEDGV